MRTLCSLLVCLVFGGGSALSQAQVQPPASEDKLPTEPREWVAPKLPAPKKYSPAEIKAECKKYEGSYISEYDKIFKVVACQRREVLQKDSTQAAELKGKKIIQVEAITIAKIPEGEKLGGDEPQELVSCQKLEGRYVLSRDERIYYINGCKKLSLPDWDTYVEHARKKGKRGQDLLEVSEESLYRIASGSAIPSILDEEYKKLLDVEKPIELIPRDEACKGLNGRFVSYYSRIYKIQACEKKPVEPTLFLQKFPGYKLEELSSDQYISLPTGTALKL